MTLSIIGAGNVGGTLGIAWSQRGHSITFGVPNPRQEKVQAVVRSCAPGAKATSVADAARKAEIIVLATPWAATRDAVEACGDLGERILIDATNPIALGAEGLQAGLLCGHTASGAETIRGWARGGRIVKAFNTIGAVNMQAPVFPEGAATMFVCGDDAAAKRIVAGLADQLGFASEDAGDLTAARMLEPLAMLWIHLAFRKDWGTGFGFRVVRRASN